MGTEDCQHDIIHNVIYLATVCRFLWVFFPFRRLKSRKNYGRKIYFSLSLFLVVLGGEGGLAISALKKKVLLKICVRICVKICHLIKI